MNANVKIKKCENVKIKIQIIYGFTINMKPESN